MKKTIKLPKTEEAAEIISTFGQVYFPGDGTCVVPVSTLQRLHEKGIKYELAGKNHENEDKEVL